MKCLIESCSSGYMIGRSQSRVAKRPGSSPLSTAHPYINPASASARWQVGGFRSRQLNRLVDALPAEPAH